LRESAHRVRAGIGLCASQNYLYPPAQRQPVTINEPIPHPIPPRHRASFGEDFRRFFLRGTAALLPTLITLWLLIKVWNFLWQSLGVYLVHFINQSMNPTVVLKFDPAPSRLGHFIMKPWQVEAIGVVFAIVAVYIVGLLVGNLIGRTIWRLAELAVMRIPLVRAIYPAVKQVTDFVLTDRSHQFQGSHVVAVEPHEKGIWSIGLVTGPGLRPLSDKVGEEMVTVFVPSTPTAFSGYVLVVPRRSVVELPIKVDEAMRLLISGGVIAPPGVPKGQIAKGPPAIPSQSATQVMEAR
jgi:uncharacterized membrane protein